MTEERIAQLNRERFSLLRALYDSSEGDPLALVPLDPLAQQIGVDRRQAMLAAEYLKGEGLLEFKTFGPTIAITHQGVVEVERALAAPDEPTDYFPPVNMIYVGQMVNSQIQQGTVSSSQEGEFSSGDIAGLASLMARLQDSLAELRLPDAASRELRSEIQTVGAQTASPRPKAAIIREALRSIRVILEGAAGSAIASALLHEISRFS